MSSSETYDKSISDEPSGQVFLNIPPMKWSDLYTVLAEPFLYTYTIRYTPYLTHAYIKWEQNIA